LLKAIPSEAPRLANWPSSNAKKLSRSKSTVTWWSRAVTAAAHSGFDQLARPGSRSGEHNRVRAAFVRAAIGNISVKQPGLAYFVIVLVSFMKKRRLGDSRCLLHLGPRGTQETGSGNFAHTLESSEYLRDAPIVALMPATEAQGVASGAKPRRVP